MKKPCIKKGYRAFVNKSKLLAKDLKRVRWPKKDEARKTYVKVIIFVFIAATTLFLLAIGLTSLWESLGLGVKNG